MPIRGLNTIVTTISVTLLSLLLLYLFLSLMTDGDIKRVFTILMATGAFGGLIFGFFQRENRFDLPYFDSPSKLYFGSLADCFIGLGAAHGVFFILAGSVNISQGNSLDDTLRLVALGLVSGIAGKSILSSLRSRLVKQIEELGEKVEHSEKKADKKDYYNLGVSYRLEKKWQSAKWSFKEAIRIDADYTSAYLGLAEAQRDEYVDSSRTDKDELIKDALKNCSLAIHKEPDFAPAYLTRATLYALFDSDKAKSDILMAVRLKPEMKQFIFEEFSALKSEEWFIKILE
ncbi:MAG TPA: hypothetical protein VJR02_14070 [Pyrinomonadaceae bacterium]|nr:hypothetical protein [Pyrinomonadaceae bacterium]